MYSKTLFTAFTAFLSVASAADLPKGDCTGRLFTISRSSQLMQIFTGGSDGQVYTASYEPQNAGFYAWEVIPGIKIPKCGIVTAVARNAFTIDIFAVDNDKKIMYNTWKSSWNSCTKWQQAGGGLSEPGAQVGIVKKNDGEVDIFVVGLDQRAWRAKLNGDAYNGWQPIGNLKFPRGAPINGVSRAQSYGQIFATDVDGKIQTCAIEPNQAAYGAWSHLLGGAAAPGAHVSAVSRSTDIINVYVVGIDQKVWGAEFQKPWGGFRGWWRIGSDITMAKGSYIAAVSRQQYFLDLYVVGANNNIYLCYWSPNSSGWQGWLHLNGGQTHAGGYADVVVKQKNHLDVFHIGLDRYTAYTAHWQPENGANGFCGWYRIFQNAGKCAS